MALFIATDKGCHLIGIDLTQSFVETGNHLGRLVGLENQVMLNSSNALALPFAENEFDAAYVIHVGMNIANKNQLIGKAARVINPGGHFVIYDGMQMRDSTLPYPMPWAETEKTSAVGSPIISLNALARSGLVALPPQNKRDFALLFFDQMMKNGARKQPPALGLHLVMGAKMPQKIQNVQQQIRQGVLAPLGITASRELAS